MNDYKLYIAGKFVKTEQKLVVTNPFDNSVVGETYLAGKNELEKAELTSWNALGRAVMHGALGNYDEAFKWIAYEPHHVWIPWVAVMPMWKPLYDDPRYTEFVTQLNIPK